MYQFISRRIAQAAITVLVVSIVVFGFMNVAGDPAALLLPPEASPSELEVFRRELGLDRPAHVRYFTFMTNFWYSDRVKSFRYSDRLMPLVLSHLRWTLVLATAALVVAMAVAIPLGAVAALHRGRIVDVLIRLVAVSGESVPSFVTGILLMYVLAVQFPIFPVAGLGLRNAVLPVTTLAMFQLAVLLRLFRSELLEVFGQDYIRTARAKGLWEQAVLVHHAFRNAAIPVLAMAGLLLNFLVLGAVVVEPIFAWPGLGWL
ncbi:MAG: ABC transporter permease, partial [Armatimonadetes bacterium]|nr:ABC transporter permease [Armatimonadota bacterium]